MMECMDEMEEDEIPVHSSRDELYRKYELEAVSALAVRLLHMPPPPCEHQEEPSFTFSWRRK
jgi:hypothetical protein